jgi:cellulose synthase operon protein C
MWAHRPASNLTNLSAVKLVALKVAAVGLVVMGVCGGTERARAQGKTVGDILRNIEKKSEQIQLNKQQSQLPQFQAAPVAPPTAKNLSAVKPPKSSRLFVPEDQNEADLMKATDESIGQLYKLTQKYSKSTRRGELWLRLAEVYVEKARLVEFQIQNRYDKDMNDFLAKKRKAKPKLNLEPAMAYNRKSIQLYEWFIRDFEKDPKLDQALFFLGYNHFELNEPQKGEQYYVRLTKEFPNSSYVIESNFALGEFYFDNEKWTDAKPYYERVTKEKKHRLYSFAMYKLAWVNYKSNDIKRGLKYLEEVILEGRRGKTQGAGSGVSQIRLATEAIKDLIVFYAEVGDPTKARAYFESVIGPKSAPGHLGRLAQYYMDTGNRSGATYLFKDLIADAPMAAKSFEYQQNIVKMWQTSGDTKLFTQELMVWIENYGPSSEWYEPNKKDQELAKSSVQAMESTLRNYVLQQHQTAQNSRAKTSQGRAKEGYDLYFKTFPNTPKSGEMHFFYGELLFDLNDYMLAAFHYNKAVEGTPPESEIAQKALLNQLLALEKKLPTSDQVKKIVGTSKESLEFPDEIKQFEAAATKYFSRNPRGENIAAIRFRLAALHYYFNHFSEAEQGFRDIIAQHPKTEYAEYSANLLLDIYNIKGDYAGLQTTAEEILKNQNLSKTTVGAQIRDIKLQADFKLAKDLEDKKEYGKAAEAYLGFAKSNKANPLAVTALYNSAINFERAGDLFQALPLYETVAANKAPTGADLKKNAIKFLPPLYEKTGQYEKAARAFETWAKENPKDGAATGYLFNAAVIYDGMNSYANAIRNYESYFNSSKKADRAETLFLLGRVHERMKSYDKAVGYFDRYLKAGPTNAAGVVEAAATIAKIHELRGLKGVAEEWHQKTVNMQKNLSRKGQVVGVSFAARSKFKLVKKTYDDFVKINIPGGPAQAAAVKNKLAVLNKLKEDLKGVIIYDDGVQIVAALTLQGQALLHMYESLMKAPVPKGMTAEEEKTYRDGVEQQLAGPFKTQALEVLDLAAKRGLELQAYCPELILATRLVSGLRGDKNRDLNPRVKVTLVPDLLGVAE